MRTIVEVGAHEGVETLHFLQDVEANVYAFEPDIEKFRDLQIKSQSYPRLTVLPFAVDLGDNQEPLFKYPNGQSTLDNPFFRKDQPESFRLTWTMRLDTFMSMYGIEKIDYLRIDAPFYEEHCLDSLTDRIKDVERGRIKLYQDSASVVPAWLIDHGFSITTDLTINEHLPDITFWR
jgi:FkbM family methyltransferase